MTWTSSRGVALAAVCAAIIGVTACGDSDDGGSNDSAQRTTTTASLAATTEGSDEQQIAATLLYASNSFKRSDGAAFCAKLSTAGLKQYVASMRMWGRKGPCPAIVKQGAALQRQVPMRPVSVSAVKPAGAKATAKMQGGISGNSGATLALVKEGGEWKIADFGWQNPSG